MRADGFVEYVLWPYMMRHCPFDWRYEIDHRRGSVSIDWMIDTFDFGMINRQRYKYHAEIDGFVIFDNIDPLYIIERSLRVLKRKFSGRQCSNVYGFFTLPEFKE